MDEGQAQAHGLVTAFEVLRTPQGSLALGNQEVILERTGSGRLRVSMKNINYEAELGPLSFIGLQCVNCEDD